MNTAKTRNGKKKFNVEIETAGSILTADAGTGDGGDASGPSPHDYIATSLAACTAITLRMYAARKSWPLSDLNVEVRLTKEGEAHKFERTLSLPKEITVEQADRLVEIANKCPIHQLLQNKIEIFTRLGETLP